MFQEILKSQIHVAVGAILLFAVLGAIAGFALALPAYFLSARAGAFTLGWKHDRWLRVATVLWLLVTFTLLGGLIGGCEGSLGGLRRIVEKSQFRAEALRRASSCAATLFVTLDLCLQNEEAGKPWTLSPEQDAFVSAFTEGKHEIDVAASLGRLERAEAQLVRKHLPRLKDEAWSRLKLPRSRLIDALVESALESLLRKVLREKLAGEVRSYGADVEGFLRDLPAAARLRGDPQHLSKDEFCTHIEERILIPLILGPARGFVRGQQLLCALGIAGAWLLPVTGFWIGRLVRRRRAATESPPTAPASPAGSPPGP